MNNASTYHVVHAEAADFTMHFLVAINLVGWEILRVKRTEEERGKESGTNGTK